MIYDFEGFLNLLVDPNASSARRLGEWEGAPYARAAHSQENHLSASSPVGAAEPELS